MKRTTQRILCCAILCAAFLSTLPAVSAADLPDVPGGFWAEEAVQGSVSQGYFYPESDGSFGTGKNVKRGEAAALLCRFFGWRPNILAARVYEDVTPDLWYAGAVETALRQGALTTISSTFRPEDDITREELAVILVRALGYGAFAGLAQEMNQPFSDVTSNAGYISIIYGLGLMDGTSATSFSPKDPVTREQAAVILMRMHEKLYEAAPSRSGIVSSARNLPDLAGYEAVAVSAYRLAYNGLPQLAVNMEPADVDAVRSAARSARVPQLLHVAGGAYQFREGNAEDLAEVLLEAAGADGYDGIFLQISGLTSTSQRKELTATAELLREGIGSKILYIAAEAPSSQGRLAGYDYTALGELADRLVLTIESPVETVDGLTTAPLEPLEETYFGLGRMRGLVDAGKLSLMVTSTGSAWGRDAQGETVTGMEIEQMLAEGRQVRSFYSTRYACAYLEGEWEEEPLTVWYLDGRAIEERIQLGRLFNVEQLCVTELDSALPELLEALP